MLPQPPPPSDEDPNEDDDYPGQEGIEIAIGALRWLQRTTPDVGDQATIEIVIAKLDDRWDP